MRSVTMAGCFSDRPIRRAESLHRLGRLLCLALVGLLAAAPAHALRCNGRLVTYGDHQVDVLDRCGAPIYVANRTVYPYVVQLQDVQPHDVQLAGDHARDRGRLVRVANLPILVEEWVYELGSRRFRQVLRFRDGRLVEIESIARPR